MGHEHDQDAGGGTDPDGDDAQSYDGAVRLIGDQPYLLIEFVPTGRDVELRMSCDRISCDGSVEGFAQALEAVIEEIRH